MVVADLVVAAVAAALAAAASRTSCSNLGPPLPLLKLLPRRRPVKEEAGTIFLDGGETAISTEALAGFPPPSPTSTPTSGVGGRIVAAMGRIPPKVMLPRRPCRPKRRAAVGAISAETCVVMCASAASKDLFDFKAASAVPICSSPPPTTLWQHFWTLMSKLAFRYTSAASRCTRLYSAGIRRRLDSSAVSTVDWYQRPEAWRTCRAAIAMLLVLPLPEPPLVLLALFARWEALATILLNAALLRRCML